MSREQEELDAALLEEAKHYGFDNVNDFLAAWNVGARWADAHWADTPHVKQTAHHQRMEVDGWSNIRPKEPK